MCCYAFFLPKFRLGIIFLAKTMCCSFVPHHLQLNIGWLIGLSFSPKIQTLRWQKIKVIVILGHPSREWVSVSSFSSKLTMIVFYFSNPGWGYGAFGWIVGSRVSVIEKPSSPLPFRSPSLCRHFPYNPTHAAWLAGVRGSFSSTNIQTAPR